MRVAAPSSKGVANAPTDIPLLITPPCGKLRHITSTTSARTRGEKSEPEFLSKIDDLYRLHRLLDGRRTPVSRQMLIDELGISRSTLIGPAKAFGCGLLLVRRLG